MTLYLHFDDGKSAVSQQWLRSIYFIYRIIEIVGMTFDTIVYIFLLYDHIQIELILNRSLKNLYHVHQQYFKN